MKNLLLTAFLLSYVYGNASNYYFSSITGDDNRTSLQAQSSSTPWKTLQKLNVVLPGLFPGDTIFLKRGDVFEGRINVTKSGTAAKNIVITAYGTGAKPVISGLAALRNFVLDSGNVWAHALYAKQPAVLLVNDKQQPLGRYPNASDAAAGFLTFESHVSTTSITDNQLSTAINWTGAELVLRKRRWVLDRSAITSQSGTTLYYTSTSTYEPFNNWGYFIQNHKKTLDKDGEWAFDKNTKKLYLYKDNFSTATTDVRASVLDTLIYIAYQSYVTLKDLHFKGANENAVALYSTKYITLSGCEISHAGLNGIYLTSSTNITIENSVLRNCNNNAIATYYGCSNIRIKGNTITNTGVVPGMGKTGDLSYQAITLKGKNNVVEYNRIDSTGYVPIRFEGDSCTVQNNFITNFLFVKDDGGGIYTWNNDYGAPENVARSVRNNIILNGGGAGAGTDKPTESFAHGIYLDDNAANVDIWGNTVAAVAKSGLFVHNSRNVVVRNNTFYNNERQIYLQDDDANVTPVRKVEAKGNVLFAKTSAQQLMHLRTVNDDLAFFYSASDSNFLCRPLNSKPSIYTAYSKSSAEFQQVYDPVTWKAAFQKDGSSKPAPVQAAQYQNNGLLSGNKIVNSTFDYNVNYLYGYAYAGSHKLEWDNTGKLDGGCLRVTLDTITNNRAYAIVDVGAVTAGKTYLLKFSVLGKSNNKSLSLFLRKTGSPYNRISDYNYAKVISTRTENEFLFIPTETQAAASLVFDISDQGSVWLDNLGFYEANITVTNPDNYLRFEYNGSAVSKSVALDASYVDAKNTAYSGTISLAPYTSLVLIRTGAAKQNQSITFTAISNKIYGNAPFLLSATASSGLAVSYRVVSGPATVSGNTVTLTGAGTVIIEASQAGNATYNAAIPVQQTFTVSPATATKQNQTITFSSIATKMYGEGPFALTATASSGLAVSYRVVSGPAAVSGNTVSLSVTGRVTIEASQAGNTTYNAATPVQQSFDVIKADQSITFPAIANRTYGTAPFTIGATANSGLAVSFRVVSGPATVSGSTVTLTGTGTVTIEASQTGDSNFNAAAPVQQSFSVTSGAISGTQSQTITFGSLSYKVYGDPPFALTATASSGLPVSYRVVSGPATVSASTVTITGAGTVTIEAMQAGNATYAAATPVQRSFTVGKAGQTITFPTLPNKVYGDAPFALTATASSGLIVYYRVVSGPATVSGSTVTLTGTGTVTIEASQPGNLNYSAAYPPQRSFTVSATATLLAPGMTAAEKESSVTADLVALEVYPNPVSSSGTIRVIVSQSTSGKLEVYDLGGSLVKTFGINRFESGLPSQFVLNVQSLPPGGYIVRFVTPQGKTATTKFIVIK